MQRVFSLWCDSLVFWWLAIHPRGRRDSAGCRWFIKSSLSRSAMFFPSAAHLLGLDWHQNMDSFLHLNLQRHTHGFFLSVSLFSAFFEWFTRLITQKFVFPLKLLQRRQIEDYCLFPISICHSQQLINSFYSQLKAAGTCSICRLYFDVRFQAVITQIHHGYLDLLQPVNVFTPKHILLLTPSTDKSW